MPDLRHIRTFNQLVRYLEDELGWPLDGYGVDDLTFVYEADELGLKPSDAAKVKKIRQLRPLDSKQPWGIFFIEFDRKKLPVVVLRRILSHLVVKKRASANQADRAAWSAEDLLFISAFGEEEDGRELTFAHFHQEAGDLPTLRVLGWDGGDTELKLEHLEKKLKEHLHWQGPRESIEQWRMRWTGIFRHRVGHSINTADMLAEAMAHLATRIRDAAKTLIDRETDKGPLRKLHEAFKTHLIHDLTEEGFADTYAQTITYGLLTAAISRTEMSEGKHGTALVASNVTDMVPVTNPFLKEMLQTFLQVGGRKGGIDFDELGVQDVVELLRGDETDLPAILRDFNNKTRGEDPVLHFYEHFLSAYNKQLKVQRGVFYTPNPVVSYIVRSVDELLKTEFGLEHGLADTITWGEIIQKGNAGVPPASSSQSGQDARAPLKLPPLTDEPGEKRSISPDEFFVQILDPATGTATFPVEVIDVIFNYLKDLWKKRGAAAMPSIPNSKSNIQNFPDYWNEYVPKALLPRLHAFELMMAPYAIAHMKIGLKLAETGYKFGTEERARIYLTNALEKPDNKQAKLIGFDALAHEAEAVNKIKKSKRFTVIIGNPPYANYSANLSPEARRIVDKYRNFRGVPIRERNQLQFERNIQDDFVKFISIAQDLVAASDIGVFSYITNGTMLASTSLRGLRENLVGKFSSLFELNLHGGGNEIIAGAEDDENVFDIVQSVAIHVYVRSKPGGASEVNYADLLGRRALKYAVLASGSVKNTEWKHIQPDAENSGFTPQDEAGGGASRRLDSAFVKFGAGIKTNRDAVVICFDDASLTQTIREFDAKLASGKHAQSNIHSLLYRPFDVRKIFYHEDVVASRSLPTMKHIVAGPNIGFICSSTWTTPDRFSVGVSRLMVEMKTGTHDRGTTFFPLYRYEALMGGKAEPVHNFTSEFVQEWCATTQTRFAPNGHGDGEKTTGPEDVLFWLYGLFYSPEYRRRYRAALSQRFPIVLLTSNLELFRALARLGGELTALHLLESPKLNQPITEFIWGAHAPSRVVSGALAGNMASPTPTAAHPPCDAHPPAESSSARARTTAREGACAPLVTRIGWSDNTVWIDAPATKKGALQAPGTIGFRGVPEAVWNFHIGGYQVCQKWLKDRKGRTLSDEDIAHYHKIVISLSETIRLMAEIDEVIETHGGWPGAFQTASA